MWRALCPSIISCCLECPHSHTGMYSIKFHLSFSSSFLIITLESRVRLFKCPSPSNLCSRSGQIFWPLSLTWPRFSCGRQKILLCLSPSVNLSFVLITKKHTEHDLILYYHHLGFSVSSLSQEWKRTRPGKTESASFSLFFSAFLSVLKTLSSKHFHKTSSGGSQGLQSCQHSSSPKKLVQKAGCCPEGCDRWQDHGAELRWFTQVEQFQGAGSRALEIIPGLLQVLHTL